MIHVALLLMVAFRASAQVQVPHCEIRTEEGGRVNNASTSSADLGAGAADSRLILGRKVFFDDHTSVAGAFVGLGNGASVFDVDADSVRRGKGAIVRALWDRSRRVAPSAKPLPSTVVVRTSLYPTRERKA
jgi:hypothetical protein